MSISGKLEERDWSVSIEVVPVSGGYTSTIHVEHGAPNGKFEHQFQHFRVHRTERDAALDGLREGMIWLEQKRSSSIEVRAPEGE